jgi:hypothetical protein
MMIGLAPNLIAAIVFGLFPLLLWAEAMWNGSRRFKILTTALLIWWVAILAIMTVPGFFCDGSGYNGWGTCTGPFSGKTYERALIIAPGLVIIPIIYAIAVILRIVRSRAR